MPAAIVTCATEFVGQPSVEALLASGYDVIAHDLAFVSAEIADAFRQNHPGAQTSAAESPDVLVAEARSAFGRIDTCVLNSAFPAERIPAGAMTQARLQAAYEALVFAPLMLTNAVVPHMKAQKSGKLIFCTSAAPLRGLSNYSIYVSARGAANAAVKSLALELAPFNIQVNAVAPNFMESETYFPKALMADPTASAKILNQIPVKRLGRPEEAGGLIAYLAGPDTGFVTGQIIALAGGWA